MDMSKFMQQAELVKKEFEKRQKELAHKIFEASAGGGMVITKVNGKGEVVALKIDETVVDPQDIGMLEDLIIASVNEAIKKAVTAQQGGMVDIMGGLGLKLPG